MTRFDLEIPAEGSEKTEIKRPEDPKVNLVNLVAR
jgi:hypothetical protein